MDKQIDKYIEEDDWFGLARFICVDPFSEEDGDEDRNQES